MQNFIIENDLDIAQTQDDLGDIEELRNMKISFRMTHQRCYNPNNADYKHYGGRGIFIDSAWKDNFSQFFADMGLRPKNLTLERKDPDGPYSKDNCEWASRKSQSRNRLNTLTLTKDGITRSLAEWSEITGISYSTLKARKRMLGYSDAECLSKEVKCGVKLSTKTYSPRKAPDMTKVAKGFDSKLSRFTKAEALAIQTKYAEGGHTFTSLAVEFGCSIETMSRVCNREDFYNFTND